MEKIEALMGLNFRRGLAKNGNKCQNTVTILEQLFFPQVIHILSKNKDNHQSRSHHLANSDRGIFPNENAVAKAQSEVKKNVDQGPNLFDGIFNES